MYTTNGNSKGHIFHAFGTNSPRAKVINLTAAHFTASVCFWSVKKLQTHLAAAFSSVLLS